jgi:hypothetical protein
MNGLFMEEIQICRKLWSISVRAFCDPDGVSHPLAEGAGVEYLEEGAGQPGRDRRPHKGGSQGFDLHHVQPGRCNPIRLQMLAETLCRTGLGRDDGRG